MAKPYRPKKLLPFPWIFATRGMARKLIERIESLNRIIAAQGKRVRDTETARAEGWKAALAAVKALADCEKAQVPCHDPRTGTHVTWYPFTQLDPFTDLLSGPPKEKP